MLLENNKRDFINDQKEETTRMSISADVESHIIKVLTEHSYDDPLGSSIREAVSNAVDSVAEAGNNQPIIVAITKNRVGQYELSIEDRGLGLDDASFKKYIMGLGESTKRGNASLLGGYGAGSKAWLSYTDNFHYVCRKDGVERQYLIFKGEEFPECTLISEQPTTEPNGVKVSVLLKNQWSELTNCKTKIQQQLAYLEGVYYKIDGFQNQYTVYKNEDFQFSDIENPSTEMHISLKNIRYPINWGKVGLPCFHIPIGLRFDDYQDIKPIFNRESIQYNSQTIKAIQDKIAKVCKWFVEKWNEGCSTYNDFPSAIYTLARAQRQLSLFNKTFDIEMCEKYDGIKFKPADVAGITLKDPSFYLGLLNDITDTWEADAVEDRGTWRKKHIKYDFENRIASMKYNANNDSKIVLVNYTVAGNIKEYLRSKYKNKVFYVKESSSKRGLRHKNGSHSFETYYNMLVLRNKPKDKWRDYIKEFQTVVSQFQSTFIDERDIESNINYINWLQAKRDLAKANRVVRPAKSKALAKGEGEITIYKARLPKRSADITVAYDKVKEEISTLPKVGKLVVYGDINDTFPVWLVVGSLHGQYKVWAFNTTELKYVKDFSNFVTVEEFIETKPFARMATAFLIEQLLKQDLSRMDVVTTTFPNMADQRKKLKDYMSEHLPYASDELKSAVIDIAAEINNWDMTIHSEVIDYGKKVRSFGFLGTLKDSTDWRTNDVTKKIIQNMMYIMLKHQKLNNTLVEDFELVPKLVAAPVPDTDNAATIVAETEDTLTF